MNIKRRVEEFLPLDLYGVVIMLDKDSKRITGISKKDGDIKYDEPRDRITLTLPDEMDGAALDAWRTYFKIFLDDLNKSVYFDDDTPETKIIKDDGSYYLVRLINTSRKREMSKVENMDMHMDENGLSWAEITELSEHTVRRIIDIEN